MDAEALFLLSRELDKTGGDPENFDDFFSDEEYSFELNKCTAITEALSRELERISGGDIIKEEIREYE